MCKKTPDEHVEFIRLNAEGISNKQLAEMVNLQFGTSYTAENVNCIKKNRHISSGLSGRFAKGHVPWCAGKSLREICKTEEAYRRVRSRWFREGDPPHNHRPVGTEAVTADGYVKVKVGEPDRWAFKHRLIYEKAHGPIPKGMMVAFIDGDRQNMDIGNLMLIDKPTNAKRKKYSSLIAKGADDINKAIILASSLESRIAILDGTASKDRARRQRARKRKEERSNG